jgi:type II secretory pathway pseudopilin PulG
MIGAVLAFVLPKVQEIQDKAIIEQSIDVMENLNEVIISAVQGGVGNKRVIDLEIKDGIMKINSTSDIIFFEIESTFEYSEPGQQISIGSIIAETTKTENINLIILSSNYSRYNITYTGEEIIKEITKSPTPYTVSIEHKIKDDAGKVNIDFIVTG